MSAGSGGAGIRPCPAREGRAPGRVPGPGVTAAILCQALRGVGISGVAVWEARRDMAAAAETCESAQS